MSLRYRVCPDCGDMHDVNDWPGNHVKWNEVVCSPSVVRDGLDDLFHPMDNNRYDSKRKFSAVTNELGGVEIGTSEQQDNRYYDTAKQDDVAQAKQMVDQGYKPNPETANLAQTLASTTGSWESA